MLIEAGQSPQSRSRAVFLGGDAVRGLGALHVLALHAAHVSLVVTGNAQLMMDPYGTWGRVGGALLFAAEVSALLFFALSGYLLSRPFVRAYVEGTRFPRPGRYAWHRILRVVPLYFIVLTVALLLIGAPTIPADEVLRAYAFSLDWNETRLVGVFDYVWTLNAEMRFYLLLPIAGLVLVGVGRLAGARLVQTARALSVVALSIAVAITTLLLTDGVNPYLQPGLSALFAFMPGVLLAAVELLPVRSLTRPRVLRATSVVAVGVVVWWLLQLPTPFGGAIGEYLWRDLIMLAVLAGLLTRQWSGRGAPRLVVNRVTNWLGTRSYGVFLAHGPVLVLLAPELTVDGRYKATFVVLLLVTVAVTAVVAEVLHRVVELPAMRLRNVRLVRRRAPALAHSAESSHQ